MNERQRAAQRANNFEARGSQGRSSEGSEAYSDYSYYSDEEEGSSSSYYDTEEDDDDASSDNSSGAVNARGSAVQPEDSENAPANPYLNDNLTVFEAAAMSAEEVSHAVNN